MGPGYSKRIIEFVSEIKKTWRPEIAIKRSDSLRRCMGSLQNFR